MFLEEELEKNFPFDFEISWDKRNHAVEVSFLLEAQKRYRCGDGG